MCSIVIGFSHLGCIGYPMGNPLLQRQTDSGGKRAPSPGLRWTPPRDCKMTGRLTHSDSDRIKQRFMVASPHDRLLSHILPPALSAIVLLQRLSIVPQLHRKVSGHLFLYRHFCQVLYPFLLPQDIQCYSMLSICYDPERHLSHKEGLRKK